MSSNTHRRAACATRSHMKILVLNSGSSSQKSALFELGPESGNAPAPPLWEGKLEWDGEKEELQIRNRSGRKIRREGKAGVHRASVAAMIENLWDSETAVLNSANQVEIVGHRIVHGGAKLTEPVRITPEATREIEAVRAIAPLHNQAGLDGIELAEKLFHTVPQVAVFDTGFHRTLSPKAHVYPGPYSWYEQGIRRFGFHGINHEYCAHRAVGMLERDVATLKIISCHLGNGCSLCAIDGGKSIDTTMGFTPLEGLMMGTRSGSIDPGIIVQLLRGDLWDPRRNPRDMAKPEFVDKALNHESGLLGISGLSSDMRDIVAAMRAGNDRAKLAFDIFIHRLTKEIGAMAASLGGVDALVFTAGIGENSPEVRAAACEKLSFLGIQMDAVKNSSLKSDAEISSTDSKVRVLVIRAQEDWAIARECVRFRS
jgi:acetate kinase